VQNWVGAGKLVEEICEGSIATAKIGQDEKDLQARLQQGGGIVAALTPAQSG